MNIPYHSSERHFRLYEGYIEKIVSNWPELSVFNPTPRIKSVDTLASRIRICIAALRNNIVSGDPSSSWKTSIHITKFIAICDELTTSTTALPGQVVCGPTDKIRSLGSLLQNPSTVELAAGPQTIAPALRVVNPDEDLIKAVVVFHHHKLLVEPSTIEFTSSDYNMGRWSHDYDIAVELKPGCPPYIWQIV